MILYVTTLFIRTQNDKFDFQFASYSLIDLMTHDKTEFVAEHA